MLPHKFGKKDMSKNSNERDLQKKKCHQLEHHICTPNYATDQWSLPLFWAQVFKQFLWYFLPQLLHESILPALSLPSFSPKKHIRHITLTLDWPCSSPAKPLEASYWREEKSNIDETENVDLREVKPYKNKKISSIVDLNLKVILQEFFFFFFFKVPSVFFETWKGNSQM